MTPTRLVLHSASRRLVPVLLALLGLAACGPRGPRNVVLVSVDTLRADHLGCYGYGRDTSPFLDRLAAEGVRYEHAYSQSSWTLPSHMSMLTSLYPDVHGVTAPNRRLAPGVPTLAERLREAGLHTAGIINTIYLRRKFGFAQGFDDYVELVSDEMLAGGTANDEFRARQVTDRALAWLAERPAKEPFFLFLHYYEPHADYDPPPPYETLFDPGYDGPASGAYRWIRPYIKYIDHDREVPPIEPRDREHVVALYDGEIRYVDDQLARLYDALAERRLLGRTLLVVTADHGEEFDDHGSMEGHGWTVYEEVVHVPLLVRFPDGRQAGTVVGGLAQSIDIGPTILDWLGLPRPRTFQGRSLLPGLGAGLKTPRRLAFSQTRRFAPTTTVRDGRWRLIQREAPPEPRAGLALPSPGSELYDLQADPGEQHDLYGSRPAIGARLEAYLAGWRRANAALVAPARGDVELTPAEVQRLKSLGYLQ